MKQILNGDGFKLMQITILKFNSKLISIVQLWMFTYFIHGLSKVS
jgi:hypothetical protein